MTKEDALKKLEEVKTFDYEQVVKQSTNIKKYIKESIIGKYKPKKQYVYYSIIVSKILNGASANIVKKLDAEFEKASLVLKIPIEDLKIYNSTSYNFSSTRFPSFYIRGYKYESESKMDIRIMHAVNIKYASIKAKAKVEYDKKKKKEAKEKKKRQDTIKLAKKLMNELGGEVYDIFNEIQKNIK